LAPDVNFLFGDGVVIDVGYERAGMLETVS